jgi:hypothetical protein
MARVEFPIEALIFLLAAMFVYEASFFVGCCAVALVGGSRHFSKTLGNIHPTTSHHRRPEFSNTIVRTSDLAHSFLLHLT